MKKVFITFGTKEIAGSRTRLKYRAIECGWFDEVHSIDESSIHDRRFIEMKERHWSERYHGNYFWKPYAIISVLEKMDDGDVLVYSDAGGEINLDGRRFFDEKMKMLEDRCLVGYGATSISAYSSDAAIRAVVGEINPSSLSGMQIQAGILYMRKCEALMRIMEEWRSLMTDNYDCFVMEDEYVSNERGYVQNRCDQTALGLLCLRHADETMILKPDFDWLLAPSLGKLDIRLSHNDILPCRRKYGYRPYAMFVAGHVIPQHEKHFDSYTHFIDVGENHLERVDSCHGDNIGDIGDLAEQTALYYIWKNIDLGDLEYIGFSTYRKPFMLDNGTLYDFLESGYDCIANWFPQNRKKQHLMAFEESVIEGFREKFMEIHPEDYGAFCEHQECGHIYPCNSFVMKRECFMSMCEYIFAVMIPYAKEHVGEHGIGSHSPYSGCFGEDIVSFWIETHCRNIKSVPFVVYPYYKRIFDATAAGNVPSLFGTWKNNADQRILWYEDGMPNVVSFNKMNFSEQIKDNGFYPDGDKPEDFSVMKTKNYIIK